MRIIAGDKRGMRLATLDGEDTRPTLERVKEGMFSSIQFVLPGARVLDLFAGSGQLGLEALSRGAAHCVFIDESREACEVVLANAKHTGLFGRCRVAAMQAGAFLARCRDTFDVILMDPPYQSGQLPGMLEAVARVAAPGAFVLCECAPGLALPQRVGGLELQKEYRYGTVKVAKYAMPG